MTHEEFKIQVYPLHKMLYSIAYRFVENQEVAEDIIQDSFVKLWEKRSELKKLKSVRAFAITMVKNASLDKVRMKKYTVGEEILNNRMGTSGEFENKEKVSMVKKIIADLPEQQRKVIELRDIDGMEFYEIEEILNMEQVTIRANLSIARKKVRTSFSKIYSYGVERN